jgi:hypothetical protein
MFLKKKKKGRLRILCVALVICVRVVEASVRRFSSFGSWVKFGLIFYFFFFSLS